MSPTAAAQLEAAATVTAARLRNYDLKVSAEFAAQVYWETVQAMFPREAPDLIRAYRGP